MIIKKMRAIVATLVVTSMALGTGVQAARADTTSTLLITAAAVGALLTGINVAEKNAKANQLVGYLPNGSPVYADGHVIAPNGQKWYPGNMGENISCNSGRCYITGMNGVGYGNTLPPGYGYPAGYGGGYPVGYGGYPQGYGGYPQGYGGYPNGYNGYSNGYNGYPNGYNGYPGGYAPTTVTTVTRTIVVRHDGDDDRARDDDDQGNGHRHHLPPGIAKKIYVVQPPQ